jgi:hemerythrin
MYIVTWSPRYSVGIDEIDGHHRHLIYLLNKIYDVFINKTPGWNLAEIFAALTDYTQCHFSAEEELMLRFQYPDFAAHKIRHDQFVKRLTAMQESFIDGKRQLSFELLTFLNTWLLSHILHADADFGKFFAAAGNQLAA